MTSIHGDGSVEFRFYRPAARQVMLAGDFTAWATKPLAMQSEGDGWWGLVLDLGAGEYRFRYLADGQWFTDYAAYGVERDEQGWNSVVRVPFVPHLHAHPATLRVAA